MLYGGVLSSEKNAPFFPLLMWTTHVKIVSLHLSLASQQITGLLPKATGLQPVRVFRLLLCICMFFLVTPKQR